MNSEAQKPSKTFDSFAKIWQTEAVRNGTDVGRVETPAWIGNFRMFLMRSRGGRGDCAPTTGQTAIAAGGALPAEVAQIDRLALGAVRAKKIPVGNGKIFIAGDNLAAGFTEPDITAREIGGDDVADRLHSVEGGNRDPIGNVAQGPVDLVGELKDAPYAGAVEKFG